MRKNSRLGYERTPIARIVCLATLLRNQTSFNCMEVARRFEVSRKTIQRDLDYLRDQLGLAFEYDNSARSWRLHSAPRAVLL